MRFVQGRTPNIAPKNGHASMRAVIGVGPQGLPGPGAAAWAAAEAVTAGAVRQAPDGSWIKSTGNRTTRASFDATEETFWVAVAADDGTVEQRALTASYVGRGDTDETAFLVGNRTTAVGAGARVKFELAFNQLDPDADIMQHYAGYSFFYGTQTGTGSLQGGSDQATAFINNLNTTAEFYGAVIGHEGIGQGDGDIPGDIPTVIGEQGTSLAAGTVDIGQMISVHASAPHDAGGFSGTVTNAYSLKAQEPTIGTNRYAVYATGASRFRKGTAADAFEVADASDVRRWGADGTILTGYGTDGATDWIHFNPGDAPAHRIQLQFVSTTKGLKMNSLGGTGDFIELNQGGVKVFAVQDNGELDLTLPASTTTPTAGSAGAPPATPHIYAKIKVNGTDYLVACYPSW